MFSLAYSRFTSTSHTFFSSVASSAMHVVERVFPNPEFSQEQIDELYNSGSGSRAGISSMPLRERRIERDPTIISGGETPQARASSNSAASTIGTGVDGPPPSPPLVAAEDGEGSARVGRVESDDDEDDRIWNPLYNPLVSHSDQRRVSPMDLSSIPPLLEEEERLPVPVPPLVIIIEEPAPPVDVQTQPFHRVSRLWRSVSRQVSAVWQRTMYREVTPAPAVVLPLETDREGREHHKAVHNISVTIMCVLLFKVYKLPYNHDVVKAVAHEVYEDLKRDAAAGHPEDKGSFYRHFMRQLELRGLTCRITGLQKKTVQFILSRYYYSQRLIQRIVEEVFRRLGPTLGEWREHFDEHAYDCLTFLNGYLEAITRSTNAWASFTPQPGTSKQSLSQAVARGLETWLDAPHRATRASVIASLANRVFALVPSNATYFDGLTQSNLRVVHYLGCILEVALGKTILKLFSVSLSYLLLYTAKRCLKSVTSEMIVNQLFQHQEDIRLCVLNVCAQVDGLLQNLHQSAPIEEEAAGEDAQDILPEFELVPQDLEPPVVGPLEERADHPQVRDYFMAANTQLTRLIWNLHYVLAIESAISDPDIVQDQAFIGRRSQVLNERTLIKGLLRLCKVNLDEQGLFRYPSQGLRPKLDLRRIERAVNASYVISGRERREDAGVDVVERTPLSPREEVAGLIIRIVTNIKKILAAPDLSLKTEMKAFFGMFSRKLNPHNERSNVKNWTARAVSVVTTAASVMTTTRACVFDGSESHPGLTPIASVTDPAKPIQGKIELVDPHRLGPRIAEIFIGGVTNLATRPNSKTLDPLFYAGITLVAGALQPLPPEPEVPPVPAPVPMPVYTETT